MAPDDTSQPDQPDTKETAAVPLDTDLEDTTDENTPAEEASDAETGAGAAASEDVEAVDREPDAASTEDTETAEDTDTGEVAADAETSEVAADRGGFSYAKLVAFGILPALALILGAAAGFLKWQDNSVRAAEKAADESIQVAKDSTVKMLSYKPDTVEQDLGAARDLLTGAFQDSYTQLTHDVVIPGSKEKQISAVASVPAVASISATSNHAEALVFVNQTVIVGNGGPTATASSVKVTLDKVGDRWLISGFDPV